MFSPLRHVSSTTAVISRLSDLEVDTHHTIEDVGISIGEALRSALGDKSGIRRFGSVSLPLDEALIDVALDLSGRPFLVYEVEIPPSDVSGLAVIATTGSASNLVAGTVPAAQMPALTGDVTSTAGSVALAIAANAVTNVKLADMATATLKGRTTAGTGDPEDLTAAQAKTLLNLTGTNSGDQTITPIP